MAAHTDISIRVYRFFRTYAPKYETVEFQHPVTGELERRARLVKGEYEEVHWVEYGPLGRSDRSVIQNRVRDLMAVGDMSEAQRNPTILIAAARWEAIRPLYENWLKGIEPTADGVPLAAWAGIEASAVELLRMHGIHTVQQLARLNDTHIQNLGIPGLRIYIDNAKTFIATLDNQVIIEQLNQKDQRIAQLEDDLQEMKRMMADVLRAKQNGQDPIAALESDPAFDPPENFVDPRADEEEFVADVGEPRKPVELPNKRKK